MEKKKEEIIGAALEIYMKCGIKSVTMDEMARQLGISKKTLYLFVKDKNNLVEECVQLAQKGEVCRIDEISKTNENAIDELLEVSRFIVEQLNNIHPSIFFDIQKYHPKAMKIMEEHKHEFVCTCVLDNLNKGLKQGFYRDNLNAEIMSRMYLVMLDHVMSTNLFEKNIFSMDEIYREFFRYHIRGIASKKGLNYLEKIKKNHENL